MDCPLNNTFLLTFRTLVWRILQVRALTVVSCCRIFPNPSRQYSKRQTRGEEIKKCLDGVFEPTYYFSIFSFAHSSLYRQSLQMSLFWPINTSVSILLFQLDNSFFSTICLQCQYRVAETNNFNVMTKPFSSVEQYSPVYDVSRVDGHDVILKSLRWVTKF